MRNVPTPLDISWGRFLKPAITHLATEAPSAPARFVFRAPGPFRKLIFISNLNGCGDIFSVRWILDFQFLLHNACNTKFRRPIDCGDRKQKQFLSRSGFQRRLLTRENSERAVALRKEHLSAHFERLILLIIKNIQCPGMSAKAMLICALIG